MESESETSGRGRGSKRASSRHSITTATDANQDTVSARSQRSSGTSARYRWVALTSARVHIRSRRPTKEIQNQINDVVGSKVSAERRIELSHLAQELCDGFDEVLSGAAGKMTVWNLSIKPFPLWAIMGVLLFQERRVCVLLSNQCTYRYTHFIFRLATEHQAPFSSALLGPRFCG